MLHADLLSDHDGSITSDDSSNIHKINFSVYMSLTSVMCMLKITNELLRLDGPSFFDR